MPTCSFQLCLPVTTTCSYSLESTLQNSYVHHPYAQRVDPLTIDGRKFQPQKHLFVRIFPERPYQVARFHALYNHRRHTLYMRLVLFRMLCNLNATVSSLLPTQRRGVNVAAVVSFPEGADYADETNHDSFSPMDDTYMSSHKLTCTLGKNMTRRVYPTEKQAVRPLMLSYKCVLLRGGRCFEFISPSLTREYCP